MTKKAAVSGLGYAEENWVPAFAGMTKFERETALQTVVPAKAWSFAGVSIGMPIAGETPRACQRGAPASLLGLQPIIEVVHAACETATPLDSRLRGNDEEGSGNGGDWNERRRRQRDHGCD
jgi:hypothetical protein